MGMISQAFERWLGVIGLLVLLAGVVPVARAEMATITLPSAPFQITVAPDA